MVGAIDAVKSQSEQNITLLRRSISNTWVHGNVAVPSVMIRRCRSFGLKCRLATQHARSETEGLNRMGAMRELDRVNRFEVAGEESR